MKIIRLSIFLILSIAAYIFNNLYLEIPAFNFTGILIGAWLFIGFIGLYIGKIYKKKRGIPQEEYSYALPDIMAKIMKKVDMRTQYESSILSMFFILVGLFAFTVYVVFLSDFDIVFKILTGFNSVFGFMFMLSYLVTTYQQYVNHMETTKTINEMMKTSPRGSGELLPLKMPFANPAPLPSFPTNLSSSNLMKGGPEEKK